MDRLYHHHALSRRPELSQHFFRSPALVQRWVDDLPLLPGDHVVEIGPGYGIITEALARRGCHVVAVEKDVRLYRLLRSRFIGRTNVECHHADALRFPLPRGRYAVVSSVPFGITARLMRRLVEAPVPPAVACLVLQREAAEKFAGTPRETLFSLLHKPRFEIGLRRLFARTDFVPPPAVECALLVMRRRERPLVTPASYGRYVAFVRGTFDARGPDVRRALGTRLTSLQIKRLARDLGFATTAGPSDLSFEQWLAVFRFYEHLCIGRDPTRGRHALCFPHRAPRHTMPAHLDEGAFGWSWNG
jgi:23S rRNA (adenine-N6)-dimethyltransferase